MKRTVMIVGGGIGGLVLTRALAQLGIDVVLLERAPKLRAEGAGITLGANAMRVLAGLGLAGAVAAAGRQLRAASNTDARGKVLVTSDFTALAARIGTGHAIHRGALHELLARDLEAAGRSTDARVSVRCGTTVTAIAAPDVGAPAVTLSDGSTAHPDALIGADGLHSSVRALVLGDLPIRYAGYTCWRWTGTVPGAAAGLDTVEMWGAGARVGLVGLPGDQVYAFFVANAPRGTPQDPTARSIASVATRFAEFGGEVPRVLAAMATGGAILHHDIEEIEVRPWSRGAVGLLGDAAHAMTPNFGQGAAMAIEDAIVLARELAGHDDAAVALRSYEARRRARVDDLQRGARRLGAVAQWRSPLARWARDLAVRCTPASSSQRALEKILAHVP
jgi:2-polyprenyl-6-methoxyphenol hydroxylase-like FAD-dependent oxidoreductase